MTHLDLFSGIGGFSLAAEWAGFKTIGFVECDKYCRKVLRKHWPDVPIVEDIKNVKEIKEVVANYQGDRLEERQMAWTQRNGQSARIRKKSETTSSNAKSPITLITGGFPCQPFSVAGKREGERDDRYLWPEMFNVIKEIRSRWCLIENVTGIINMVLDNLLSDLEGEGYETQTFIIPACAVSAWHRRDRIWIVAHYASNGFNSRSTLGRDRQYPVDQDKETPKSKQAREGWECELGEISADVTNPEGRESGEQAKQKGREDTCGRSEEDGIGPNWWAVEPELGRVAHGIPNRVDRLKCLGNAIVPQVAYQILKIIYELEQ